MRAPAKVPPPTPVPRPPTGAGPWFACLASALALPSTWLRYQGLREQIPGGDELHLLRAIADLSPLEIVSAVADRDFSIPLALYGRLLSDHLPVSELVLRAPVFLVGCLAPTLFALGARRFVGSSAALLFGGLVAVHPFFILYSRFMRPYGICALLSFGALVFADRWQRGGVRKRDLAVSVVLAAVATWFNLAGIVFAGALFAAVSLRALLVSPSDVRFIRAGVAAGAGVGCLALVAALYAPALSAIVDNVVRGKVAVGAFTREDLWRNATVFAGTPGVAAVGVAGVSFGCGALIAVMRAPSVALLLGPVIVGHVAAVLLLEPHLLGFSFVLARYCIFILPPVLMLGAWAWTTLAYIPFGPRAERRRGLRSTLAVVAGGGVLAGLVFAGPYRSIYLGAPRAFAHHNAYQTFRHLELWPRGEWQRIGDEAFPVDVPAWYDRFEERKQPLILEWPAPRGFDQNPLVFYQWVHEVPLKALATEGESPWGSPRLALENVIVLTDETRPEDLLGAGFIVIHKRFADEILSALRVQVGSSAEHYRPELVEEVSRRVAALCGDPVHDDDWLRVFRGPGWRPRPGH